MTAQSDTPQRPQNGSAGLTISAASFKAPAHKHAHIIHSIPPKEKSTRTLIIDHMLWVHGRTRFAQARAELGMTDRTGGPSSANYKHRLRPENYDEDEEAPSDAEDDHASLLARTGGPDEEEERLSRYQELPLARALRLRSEAVEKVVTSMLNQPPTYHPPPDEDLLTPPASPKLPPANIPGQRDPNHPHCLPNGVRLRLALGTLINDLFARQAPPPSLLQRINSPTSGSSPSITEVMSPVPQSGGSNLPITLLPLASLSRMHSGVNTSDSIDPSSNERPSSRVLAYYAQGADPSTANSPPTMRCPRHLHHGCEICVSAKDKMSYKSARPTSRGAPAASPADSSRSAANGGVSQGGGISGWLDGAGIGSGLAGPGPQGTVLRKVPPAPADSAVTGSASPNTGEGNVKLSRLIPRFIRLSALVAIELGLEARDDLSYDGTLSPSQSPEQRPMIMNSKAAERIPLLPPPASPQYLRTAPASVLSTSEAFPGTTQDGRLKKLYSVAFRPSRSWYLLLAGLLTRAALQGYLSAGWRGNEAVDCLLSFGLGLQDDADLSELHLSSSSTTGVDHLDESDDSRFEEFEPDDLPPLREAVSLLFPSLRDSPSSRKYPEEEEYRQEMKERMKKFYSIPHLTPDLATHMEDLAYMYPAEPVERAAVRLTEAFAKWRGKPELEKHKKHPRPMVPQSPGSPSIMTIDSIVHTSPTSSTAVPNPSQPARSSIERYFLPLHSGQSIGPGSSNLMDTRAENPTLSPGKRSRATDDVAMRSAKRPNV